MNSGLQRDIRKDSHVIPLFEIDPQLAELPVIEIKI
jgi:hypothetical protein